MTSPVRNAVRMAGRHLGWGEPLSLDYEQCHLRTPAVILSPVRHNGLRLGGEVHSNLDLVNHHMLTPLGGCVMIRIEVGMFTWSYAPPEAYCRSP